MTQSTVKHPTCLVSAKLAEAARIEQFIQENDLQPRLYRASPDAIVALAFKHYTSQVEEVYRKGVMQRAAELQALYGLDVPADRLFAFEPRCIH